MPEPICSLPDCPVPPSEQVLCHYPECGRPYLRRGVCSGHYAKLRKGQPLTPIRPKRPNGTVGTSTCAFSECDRTDWKAGLCVGHYEQRSKQRPLTPIQTYMPDGVHRAALRNAQGEKRCSKCGSWKPARDFYRSSREPDGLTHQCRPCCAAQARQKTLRRYSLTEDQYEALLRAQGGVCAICREPCPRGHLSVDHDHACCPGESSCGLCVRGLLCRMCNHGIGLLRDSPDVIRSAVAYLENSKLIR